MSKKYLYESRNPPKLEGKEKEELLKAVEEEIAKIPKLKKGISKIRYYRNWVYLYYGSKIREGKDELLYRIAVFDDEYENCALELPHKGKVFIHKEGTLRECLDEANDDWHL